MKNREEDPVRWKDFPLLEAYLTERGDFPLRSKGDYPDRHICAWLRGLPLRVYVILLRYEIIIYDLATRPPSFGESPVSRRRSFKTENEAIALLRTIPIADGPDD